MSTFTDITQTGAQSYRDLLKQNNGSNLSALEAELLKAFSGWATTTPSKYDVSNLRSREIEDPIYQASGGKDYWGSSIWDDDVANAETFEHLLNERANNQWGAIQILNGIGKATTTAVTTALDGTIGTLYGIGTGISNVVTGAKNADGSDKGFMLGLWDNDFNKAMAAAQEEAEDLMPNYYTDYEREAPWYNNIFSANFIGDKIIKNAGFTIGALAATFLTGGVGATTGKAVLALAKGLAKQALKGGSISTAKNALMTGRKFGLIANYTVNAGLSAHGEAAIEAINGTNEAFKVLDANVESRRLELLSLLNPQDPDYKALVLRVNNAVLEYKNLQSGLLTQAGNNIYLSNMAILSLTNSLEFGDLIKGGYAQTAKLAKRTYTVEGKEATVGLWAKALLEGKSAQVVNGVKDGIGKTALHTAKNFLSEGFEEGALNVASNTNQYYTMAELNRRVEDKKSPLHALSLTGAEINPEASSKLASYALAYSKTLEELFGSIDAPGWEEVFLGGLTGALGFYNPMHRETKKNANGDVMRDANGKIIQQWKPLSIRAIEGGFLGAHREVSEAKEQNEQLVKLVNDATSKPEFIKRVKHAVAALDYEQAMTEALANEDKLSFKNAEIGKIINDALYFRDKGAIDEYKALFEGFTSIDDKTLGLIYLAANSKELEKEETEKVREKYLNKAKSTLEKINKTLEYYDYVEESHRSMPEDWKREMANYYIRWDNTRLRIKELEGRYNKDALRDIQRIPKADIMNEATFFYSDHFTTNKDRDDYFRLKKLEALLNKTIQEYEKNPNKLHLELVGAYLLNAAKELSLDANALIEKLKNALSPADVDEVLGFVDQSIRESVYREAFRTANSLVRGYLYLQMLMANASQALFDSLKETGLEEGSTEYVGMLQLIAAIFQLGKLNIADTKLRLQDAIVSIIDLAYGLNSSVDSLLEQLDDEGKLSLNAYLATLVNSEGLNQLLIDFLYKATKLMDATVSKYGAWEAREASRQNSSTPVEEGTQLESAEGTESEGISNSYANAVQKRKERTKHICTGELALKYPTIAAILADAYLGSAAESVDVVEKLLGNKVALLLKAGTEYGIDLAAMDKIVEVLEEYFFKYGWDAGLGVAESPHIEASLLDSALLNALINFVNQGASKQSKEQFLTFLKEQADKSGENAEFKVRSEVLTSFILTGQPTIVELNRAPATSIAGTSNSSIASNTESSIGAGTSVETGTGTTAKSVTNSKGEKLTVGDFCLLKEKEKYSVIEITDVQGTLVMVRDPGTPVAIGVDVDYLSSPASTEEELKEAADALNKKEEKTSKSFKKGDYVIAIYYEPYVALIESKKGDKYTANVFNGKKSFRLETTDINLMGPFSSKEEALTALPSDNPPIDVPETDFNNNKEGLGPAILPQAEGPTVPSSELTEGETPPGQGEGQDTTVIIDSYRLEILKAGNDKDALEHVASELNQDDLLDEESKLNLTAEIFQLLRILDQANFAIEDSYNTLDASIKEVIDEYLLQEDLPLESLNGDSWDNLLSEIDVLLEVYARNGDGTLGVILGGNTRLMDAFLAAKTPKLDVTVKENSSPNMESMYGGGNKILGMCMMPYAINSLHPTGTSKSSLVYYSRTNNYALTEGINNAVRIQRIIDYHLRDLLFLPNKKPRPVHFIAAKHINGFLNAIEYDAEVQHKVPRHEAWIVLALDGKEYMVIGVAGYTPLVMETRSDWQLLYNDIKAEYVGDERYHVYTGKTGVISNISDGNTIDEYNPTGAESPVRKTLEELLWTGTEGKSELNPLGVSPGDLKFQVMYPTGPKGVNCDGTEEVYAKSPGLVGNVYMLIPMSSGVYYRAHMKPLFLQDILSSPETASLHKEFNTIIDKLAEGKDTALAALWLKNLLHFTDNELFIDTVTVNGETALLIDYRVREGHAKLRAIFQMGNKLGIIDLLLNMNPPINIGINSLSSRRFVSNIVELGWSPESIQMLSGVGAGFTVALAPNTTSAPRVVGTGVTHGFPPIATLGNVRYKKENGTWKTDDTNADPVTNPVDIETLEYITLIESGKYDDTAFIYSEEDAGKRKELPGVYYEVGITKEVPTDDAGHMEKNTSIVYFHKDEKGNYTRIVPFMFNSTHSSISKTSLKTPKENKEVKAFLDKMPGMDLEIIKLITQSNLNMEEARNKMNELWLQLNAEANTITNKTAQEQELISEVIQTWITNAKAQLAVVESFLQTPSIFLDNSLGIPLGYTYKGKELSYLRLLNVEEKARLDAYIQSIELNTISLGELLENMQKAIEGLLNNPNTTINDDEVTEIFSNFVKIMDEDLEGSLYDRFTERVQPLVSAMNASLVLDDMTTDEMTSVILKVFKSKGLLQSLVTISNSGKSGTELFNSLLDIIENCR